MGFAPSEERPGLLRWRSSSWRRDRRVDSHVHARAERVASRTAVSGSDRLVWMYNARTERDRAPLSLPDLEDYRREASCLAGLAVFTNWTTNLTGVGTPERLDGIRVSGNFFELLGTSPALGRVLQPEDETGERRVAVMTHGLWQRRFGGDPGLIGKDVSLNGACYTVVGVLPPRFLFPFREAELAVPVTLQRDPRRADRGANFLRVVARLAPEVTLAQAKADLDAIAERLQRQYPRRTRGRSASACTHCTPRSSATMAPCCGRSSHRWACCCWPDASTSPTCCSSARLAARPNSWFEPRWRVERAARPPTPG